MPDFGVWGTLAPYHIISYGTLLGTEFFQSFVNGIVAFRCLPRPAFATLQSNIFPIYFGFQTLLPVALVATYPRSGGSIAGFLAPENRSGALVPLAVVFVTGLANAAYLEPLVTRTMRERKHQETRDGKKAYDAGPHSPAMQALNRKFGRLHGISTLVNLAGFVATLVYAGDLARAFQ